MKVITLTSTMLMFWLIPFTAYACDNDPTERTQINIAPKQVLISKSEMLTKKTGLSSVTVQTIVKTLPLDIPTSSTETNKTTIAD